MNENSPENIAIDPSLLLAEPTQGELDAMPVIDSDLSLWDIDPELLALRKTYGDSVMCSHPHLQRGGSPFQ